MPQESPFRFHYEGEALIVRKIKFLLLCFFMSSCVLPTTWRGVQLMSTNPQQEEKKKEAYFQSQD